MNIKRTYRLWKDLRIGRVKRYQKKRTETPVPYATPMQNDIWTIDIIYDRCMNGTKLRILSIVDEFTKEYLALEISTRINANTVRSVIGRLFTSRAVPRYLQSENGGELIARSTAMLLNEANWSARFIKPGKRRQNGFIESFHSTQRRDHLNVEVLFNLLDAQLKTGIYRNYYNRIPPHSALGLKAPADYATMTAGSLMVPLGYQVGTAQWCLFALLDGYSNHVVAWELSETLELPLVLDCFHEALDNSVPEIINSDQDCHFTTERFTSCFTKAGTRISMDGRGRYVDNIFTERLWRPVNKEEASTCPSTMNAVLIQRWITLPLLKSTTPSLERWRGRDLERESIASPKQGEKFLKQ